ncbi:2-keto-4-pentenoate hydratase/2-oxohepta-3-ene-1,7-dioic acid hydratase (catechol pathway) [Trueperella bialowiezensis]|uniref:2-keto-4-pentenoate hydratase/2-oxohepta-3-ene-1,7-dioic acid hydratase (Catechol pathway) n=2 Tax=Trueperella bialowiezensis TaxID=312285 RepID=A0A3S4VUJ0_9ACTO|nr:2-keto-4-pentenoate hydratase/2-oxohepta-3-ene-1,7-dioic acid hydratase (catechol pathway) [Trueperella bialowiezensis]
MVDEDTGNYIVLADDPLYSEVSPTGQVVAPADANLVSPMIPRSKVIGFGDNYNRPDYRPDPDVLPTCFLKPNTAVVGPNVPITIPEWAGDVRHEAELAVVISRIAKDVPLERVDDVIFGYTVANDVGDLAAQASDPQWARAKGFDTSCPIGPVIVTDLDTANLEITLAVNGEVRGRGTTADLVRNARELVVLASQMFTLLPGDVILTGSPFPAVAAAPGDDVVCTVEGIGELRNPVV